MISGSLWNYYRDQTYGVDDEVSDGNSFDYKTKTIGTTPSRPPRPEQPPPDPNGTQPPQPEQPPIPGLNTEVTIPLKYLNNFWGSLNFRLINCETELDLGWPRYFVLLGDNDNITGVNFVITSAKRYVPVVTLSNIKFFENIKQGFIRKASGNKYRSGIKTNPKNNNLDYMIDPTFRSINKLFVVSFKNADNNLRINSFDKYYMPLVEMKYFNALIDNKPCLDQPVKNKQEEYEKLVETSKNYDYTIGKLLDYLYHQKYGKPIGIDLSRQKNTSISQQINFIGKLDKNEGVKKIFITDKRKSNYFKLFFNFMSCNKLM